MDSVKSRTRADGDRTREAILRTAASLVTLEGITGLSIARLADAVGMSKSGLFAHFGSKEGLQLATVETACAIYDETVVAPALTAGSGLGRLNALVEGYLVHVEEGVFPGGCFFASVMAEVDTHPGPLRERTLAFILEWLGHLRQAVVDAQAEGAIDADEDPDQLVFEIEGYLLLANAHYVAVGDPLALERARRAVARRIALPGPTPAAAAPTRS